MSFTEENNNGGFVGYFRLGKLGFFDFFEGEICEFVVYSNPTGKQDRIETYLAVKYGITLDNSAGGSAGDFVSTNGLVVWDVSANPAYHNDVIGIARDDNEVLYQKQSHSFDDSLRIYVRTLDSTNAANAATINADESYTIVGHNEGKLCATAAANSELPPASGLTSRIEREWRITKTNFSQDFNLDMTLNGCANTAMVNANDLRLLVDDDGDFSNGGTSIYYNGDGTGVVIDYMSSAWNI